MANKVIIVGNLGQDPQTTTFESGGQVTNFSVATSSKYKNKEGELIEDTEWHNIAAYGKLSELADKYLQKGSKVYLEGQLKTRQYTDGEGIDRYRTDIVLREMEFLSKQGETSNGDAGDIV